MATGFNTQTGNGEYRLQFETDNEEFFLLMQELARYCVDHPKTKTNADRIRAMTDEELAELFRDIYNAGCDYAQEWYQSGSRRSFFEWDEEWLQQPAEDDC